MTRDDVMVCYDMQQQAQVVLVRAHIAMVSKADNGMIRFSMVGGAFVDVGGLSMDTALSALCWEPTPPTGEAPC